MKYLLTYDLTDISIEQCIQIILTEAHNDQFDETILFEDIRSQSIKRAGSDLARTAVGMTARGISNVIEVLTRRAKLLRGLIGNKSFIALTAAAGVAIIIKLNDVIKKKAKIKKKLETEKDKQKRRNLKAQLNRLNGIEDNTRFRIKETAKKAKDKGHDLAKLKPEEQVKILTKAKKMDDMIKKSEEL